MMDSFGGPEVLNLREVAEPQAGPGQVRVRVTAVGLNPMDWVMTADDIAGPYAALPSANTASATWYVSKARAAPA